MVPCDMWRPRAALAGEQVRLEPLPRQGDNRIGSRRSLGRGMPHASRRRRILAACVEAVQKVGEEDEEGSVEGREPRWRSPAASVTKRRWRGYAPAMASTCAGVRMARRSGTGGWRHCTWKTFRRLGTRGSI